MNNRLLSTLIIATVLVVMLIACQGQDIRYNKWSRYVDNDDEYTVFVPPAWSVENEMMPEMRGTRFFPTDKYTGSLSGFVYFSVFVIDSEQELNGERAEQLVRKVVEGTWQKLSLETNEVRYKGLKAFNFEISGVPLYSSYKLRGRVMVCHQGEKDFILMAGATEESFKTLAKEYQLILDGFKLP